MKVGSGWVRWVGLRRDQRWVDASARVLMLSGAMLSCAAHPTPLASDQSVAAVNATPVRGAASVGRSAGTRSLTLTAEPDAAGASVGTGASSEARLVMRVRASARHGGEAIEVRSGSTLHSGDALTVSVAVSRRAWIYLAYESPRGDIQVLYPPTGVGMAVEPGTMVRVPPVGQVLQLDAVPGDEHILAIATERPLDQSDPELHQFLLPTSENAAGPVPSGGHGSTTAPSRDPRDGRQPPGWRVGRGRATWHHRGVILAAEGTAPQGPLQLSSDPGGVISWRLDFHHAP
jgi:hypothetical protein